MINKTNKDSIVDSSRVNFAFKDWRKILKSSEKSFLKIWWRILVINLMSFLMIGFTALIFFMLTFLFGGGAVISGSLDEINMVVFGFLVFMFLLAVIGWGIIGEIAKKLVIKDYVHQKKTNPITLYFKDSRQYFRNYIWVGFRGFWYAVSRPLKWMALGMLLTLGIHALMYVFVLSPENSLQTFPNVVGNETIRSSLQNGMNFVAFMLGLFLVLIPIIWIGVRFFRVSLASFHYIETQKTPKESIHFSIEVFEGNWWRIFWMYGIIMLLLSIIPWILLSLIFFFFGFEFGVGGPLLDLFFSLYSLIFLTPMFLIFDYFLMLHLGKKKNSN